MTEEPMSDSQRAALLTEENVKKMLMEFWVANYKSPADLLMFDEDFRNGAYKLYKWQIEIFEKILNQKYHSQDPLELALRAVNGSGKDSIIMALFVIWTIMVHKNARVTITSASGKQLTSQSEVYIRDVANLINNYYKFEVLTVNQRKIVNNITNSDIIMFATDDEGKAEGYHPKKPNCIFVILVNEAKSIPDKIFEALSRCNGYTHWIEMSSPGKPDGHFFKYCTSTRYKVGTEIEAVTKVVVVADDCPHLGGENYKKKIEELYGSVDHYMYRSMIHCDFSSADEMVVVGFDQYNRLLKYQKDIIHIPEEKNTGGLDLSFGGDEIALVIRNGNKHLGTRFFRSKDTTQICEKIKQWFEEWKLTDATVYADAGGLGAPIVSLLRGQYGFKKIVPVKNDWAPQNTTAYYNLGAETWFKIQRLIEDMVIIIRDDDVLRKQMCNRYYKLTADNSAQLESKVQARAKGRPSPDRADAFVLCFHRYVAKAIKEKVLARQKALKEAIANREITMPTITNFVARDIKRLQQTRSNNRIGTLIANVPLSAATRSELQLEIKQALDAIKKNYEDQSSTAE